MSWLTPFYHKHEGGTDSDYDDLPWFQAVALAMFLEFLGVIAYAWAEWSWLVFACGILVGLAAVLVGALAGFIFGIPKHVATAGGSPGGAESNEYEGNTSLEQISDWLTKILVGAGLVELKGLPGALREFGLVFKENKALGSVGFVAGPAIAIAFAVSGFLLSYLWTRIYMAKELETNMRSVGDAVAPQTVLDPQQGNSV